MARLLSLTTKDDQPAGLVAVLKGDLLPWLGAAGLSLLIFIGAVWLVGGVNPRVGFVESTAYLYSYAAYFYYALIVLAVILARRSLDKWTWIIAIILILFFAGPSAGFSLSQFLLPNSILPAMVAMISLLSLGRIVEYIQIRYVIELDRPVLTRVALGLYFSLLVVGGLLNSSLFYGLISG